MQLIKFVEIINFHSIIKFTGPIEPNSLLFPLTGWIPMMTLSRRSLLPVQYSLCKCRFKQIRQHTRVYESFRRASGYLW